MLHEDFSASEESLPLSSAVPASGGPRSAPSHDLIDSDQNFTNYSKSQAV